MLHALDESVGYRLRRALIAAMRVLHDRGLVNLRGGNASARLLLEDGSAFIYITPAGKPKAMLEPEDVSVLDIDGHVYSGKPSSEYRMHLAIYRKRKDVRAVVHAHNPLAVLAAKLKLDLGADMLGVERGYQPVWRHVSPMWKRAAKAGRKGCRDQAQWARGACARSPRGQGHYEDKV
jgi:ribulose-5-phosphate 4-epimerase/fuculose-1-phosphate aldolase